MMGLGLMESSRQVVGVRFARAGRIFYFEAGGLALRFNDLVVADPGDGPKVGWVVILPEQVLLQELAQPLYPLLRQATPEDLAPQSPSSAGEVGGRGPE